MSVPITVCIYSVGDRYHALADRCAVSVRQHMPDASIMQLTVPVPRGLEVPVWRWSTHFKPTAILDALEYSDYGPVLYLDADAIMVAPPPVTETVSEMVYTGARIGAYRMPGTARSGDHGELISATLLCLTHSRIVALDWLAGCENDLRDNAGQTWDQQLLTDCLAPGELYDLGPEWCWIDATGTGHGDDMSARRYGQRQPYIVQTQASRGEAER